MVIADPEGGGFEFGVFFELKVLVDLLHRDAHFDRFATTMILTAEHFDSGEIRTSDGVEGHDDGFAILERHATDLKEAAEKIERAWVVEGVVALGGFPITGLGLTSGDFGFGEAILLLSGSAVLFDLVTDEHDRTKALFIEKADVVELEWEQGVRPTRRAAVGLSDEVIWVFGVFFAKDDIH